jgi:hypothetical protein
MTPAAITPAGRAASKKRASAHEPVRGAAPAPSARSAGATVPGHRRRLRPKSAPKAPRRVSGPSRGRLADSLPQWPGIETQPRTETRPRTKTRPRGQTRSRTKARRAPGVPLRARALVFARGLPDHPLLDRLIRGRAWIPLLGVMLAGIVAMQVEVLKLGTSIGRSIERSATLQTRNDQLRMTVAALDGDQRIERLAAARGMIMPAPETIGFLSARQGTSVRQALANVHAPDATGFLSQTTSNGGIATVAGSLAASSGSSTDTSSTTSTGSADSGSTQGALDASSISQTSSSASQDSSQTTSSTSQDASQGLSSSSGTTPSSSTAATAQSSSTTPVSAADSSSSGGAGMPVGG